jgi:hypothetical protein
MVHWKALVESFAVVYVVSSECFCRLHYRLVDFGRMVDSKVPKSTIESTNWSKICHCGLGFMFELYEGGRTKSTKSTIEVPSTILWLWEQGSGAGCGRPSM